MTGFVVVGALSCGELHGIELECEEALARLDECCPGLKVVAGYCDYHDAIDGCSGHKPATYPALTGAESVCIRRRSCSALVAAGACSRAAAAEPKHTDNPQPTGVCQ